MNNINQIKTQIQKEKDYEKKFNELTKKSGNHQPKYLEKNVKLGTVWVRNNNYSGWGISYNN